MYTPIELDIEWRYERVTVHFYYTPSEPATWDDPGDPGGIDIDKVFYKGVEVSPILRERDLEEIIERLYEEIDNDKDYFD